MRRLVWMGAGAVVAVVVTRRIRDAARRLTPDGVAERVGIVGRRTSTALRDAVGEFRTASTARERELVTALLVEPAVAGTASSSGRSARASGDPGDEDDFL